MVQNIKKLLSRLSYVDYAIVLIAISGFAYMVFNFSQPKKYIFVDLTPDVPDYMENPIPPQFRDVASIAVGDASYSSAGEKKAEVTEVNTTEWGSNRRNFEITLKLKVLYNKGTKSYTFNDTPIVIGNRLSLPIGKTQVSGKIVNLYEGQADRYKGFVQKKATVTVNIANLPPTHAEALKNFEEKNSEGTVTAQTISSEIKPAQMTVTTANGDVLIRSHPVMKDVTLTLKLSDVLCSVHVCYYKKFIPLKIGSYFWAQSDKTFIGTSEIAEFSIQDK